MRRPCKRAAEKLGVWSFMIIPGGYGNIIPEQGLEELIPDGMFRASFILYPRKKWRLVYFVQIRSILPMILSVTAEFIRELRKDSMRCT